jgi:hypothetical protein
MFHNWVKDQIWGILLFPIVLKLIQELSQLDSSDLGDLAFSDCSDINTGTFHNWIKVQIWGTIFNYPSEFNIIIFYSRIKHIEI